MPHFYSLRRLVLQLLLGPESYKDAVRWLNCRPIFPHTFVQGWQDSFVSAGTLVTLLRTQKIEKASRQQQKKLQLEIKCELLFVLFGYMFAYGVLDEAFEFILTVTCVNIVLVNAVLKARALLAIEPSRILADMAYQVLETEADDESKHRCLLILAMIASYFRLIDIRQIVTSEILKDKK